MKFKSFVINCRSEQRRLARKDASRPVPWHQTAFTDDSIVTVDNNGWVRLWEVNASRVAQSLNTWRTIVGGTTTQIHFFSS